MILYKRNAKGTPISWECFIVDGIINVQYGIVGKEGRREQIRTHRDPVKEMESLIKAKRKEGYKELQDLYDNAPIHIDNFDLYAYLDNYLPKFNTHADGKFIPMLCKTLEDNKPFEKGNYFGQWKINGERCIITMDKTNDLFGDYRLCYRSREGVDWTDKLNYLNDYLLPCIPDELKEMMIEEGVGLDGELYIPGYGINEINSFIKNTEVPQHYKLQYWLYDLCIENMSAVARQVELDKYFHKYHKRIIDKEEHLNNKATLVYLSNRIVNNINEAIQYRDQFISLGFEGLVIRESSTEYQFGGRRNNSMLKFKKKEDGLFVIVDIVPEGKKRSDLGKLVLRNDINDELFECTYNAPHIKQKELLIHRDKYIGLKALVEYRERSGNSQVPFHAKCVKINV